MVVRRHADMDEVEPTGAGTAAGRESQHEDRIGIVGAPAAGPPAPHDQPLRQHLEDLPGDHAVEGGEEVPVEEMPEYSEYVDPKYAAQLMSESMPDEDLPSTSLPRKGPASEAVADEASSGNQ